MPSNTPLYPDQMTEPQRCFVEEHPASRAFDGPSSETVVVYEYVGDHIERFVLLANGHVVDKTHFSLSKELSALNALWSLEPYTEPTDTSA